MTTEDYISQETRIRVLENIAKDTRESLRHIDTKLDNQFKWIIGTLMALFGGILLAKLI